MVTFTINITVYTAFVIPFFQDGATSHVSLALSPKSFVLPILDVDVGFAPLLGHALMDVIMPTIAHFSSLVWIF